MKKIVMGGYTGRENRGTEAIAKSVSAMFRKLNVKTSLTVRSENEFKELNSKPSLFFKAAWNKVFHNTVPYEMLRQKDFLKSAKDNIAVHIGGDTYCYGVLLEHDALVRICKIKQIPLVLWAASIDESAVRNERIKTLYQRTNDI